MSDDEPRAQSVIVRTSLQFDLNTGESLGPPTVADEIPHEQLIVRKRFQGQVDWNYWKHRPLWTVEEGFILARNYDPRRFPSVWGERRGETQSSPVHYPFGPNEIPDIERIVSDAFALGELIPIGLRAVEGMTPAELFRAGKVKPSEFLAWYNAAQGWPWALRRELPAQLKAFMVENVAPGIAEIAPDKSNAIDLTDLATAFVAEMRKSGIKSNKKIVARMDRKLLNDLTGKQLGKALLKPGDKDTPAANEKRAQRAQGTI